MYNVYLYVCMYVCMYVCIYVCICMTYICDVSRLFISSSSRTDFHILRTYMLYTFKYTHTYIRKYIHIWVDYKAITSFVSIIYTTKDFSGVSPEYSSYIHTYIIMYYIVNI